MRARNPLIESILSFSLAIPLVMTQPVANGAPDESQETATRLYPATRSPAVWRALLYLHGGGYFDQTTWVEGGVEGSAMLVIQDRTQVPAETSWVFVEGDTMYMRIPGEPKEKIVIEPAEQITSAKGEWNTATKKYERDKLSFYLMKLASQRLPAGKEKKEETVVRHTPFLTGYGWPNGLGASREVAEAIISSSGKSSTGKKATMVVLGTHQVGRVIGQFPQGGTPIPDSINQVGVVLDGKKVTRLGRTSHDPIIVPVGTTGLRRFLLSSDVDDQKGSCEPNSAIDLFFQLPQNKNVTVRVAGLAGPRMTLTAWETADVSNDDPTQLGTGNDFCVTGRLPQLPPITTDAAKFTLISIAIAKSRLEEHGPELVELAFEW